MPVGSAMMVFAMLLANTGSAADAGKLIAGPGKGAQRASTPVKGVDPCTGSLLGMPLATGAMLSGLLNRLCEMVRGGLMLPKLLGMPVVTVSCCLLLTGLVSTDWALTKLTESETRSLLILVGRL